MDKDLVEIEAKTPLNVIKNNEDRPYRILVTGSRTWDDEEAIMRGLVTAQMEVLALQGKHGIPILVSGACPIGADFLAEKFWARTHGEEYIERHPADWKRLGKKAGFARNSEMVKLGADVCVAFIKDGSKGATMTADLAEKAGIPTRRIVS